MRFLAIVCLIGLLLSVAISSKTSVEASSNTCISPNALPTTTGTSTALTANQPSVVFNEVLPFPYFRWNCDSQTSPNLLLDTWVELYNLTNQPLDLYKRICVDTGSGTAVTCLPIDSIIPAHSFFTFFPYLINNNFLIKGDSDIRLLLDGVPIDQVHIPVLPRDVSYARLPDGTGKWQPDTNPTINASNAIMTSPSPTPTHLQKKQESKSKAAAQGRKKYARNTGSQNIDAQITTSTTSNENPHVQNDLGKQAQWPNLQFPSSLASPSALTSALNRTEDSHSPSHSTPAENIPQNILFSLMGIAGLLSLWWGWRYFFKKRS